MIVPKSEPQHPGRQAWSSSVFGTNGDRAKLDWTEAPVPPGGRGAYPSRVRWAIADRWLGHQPRNVGQSGIPDTVRDRPGVGSLRGGSEG